MFMISPTPYARGQHHCKKNKYVYPPHKQSEFHMQSMGEISEEVTFSEDLQGGRRRSRESLVSWCLFAGTCEMLADLLLRIWLERERLTKVHERSKI